MYYLWINLNNGDAGYYCGTNGNDVLLSRNRSCHNIIAFPTEISADSMARQLWEDHIYYGISSIEVI